MSVYYRPRKTRYWVCHNCNNVYNRRKHDEELRCYSCYQPMTKARVYPYAVAQRKRKTDAQIKQQQLLLRKRHNRCRNAFGYRLRPTPTTPKAFRHLKDSKQRRSFIKRANAFLIALRNDIWTCQHERTTAEKRTCGCESISCYAMTAAPKCDLSLRRGGTLGTWTAAPPLIKIQWKGEHIYETLIHEAVHYIDFLADVGHDKCVGSHSREFYKRCQDLARLLGQQGMEHFKG